MVKSLKNGVVLNLLGMGAAILGMQATVGTLVAKALTTSAVPYYQGISPGQSPVLALDVFLVQVFLNIFFGRSFENLMCPRYNMENIIHEPTFAFILPTIYSSS